jgi:hypothetical protein
MKPFVKWWSKRTERERLLTAFALGEITMLIVVVATLMGWLGGPIKPFWL